MDSFEEEVTNNVAHLESKVLKSSFTMIAPCFENLSTLKVLDLSRTNIQSLPPSISMLSLLVNLTMQECSMLMVIPPEIGSLKNVTTFDLEGTEIMYLPKEMGKLENLQCLRVSFCAYADEYKDRNGIENIIPRTIMSKFSKLEELSIFVNPDAKWWEIEFTEAILDKLHFLPCLRILNLYLPTAKKLQYFLQLENCQVPIYSNLRDFRLKVGHCEQLPSYLKTKLVDSFEKLEKCLKYENGEGNIHDVMELVRHAKALFVCRHSTIEKLSIFDISRLKYCLLAECNNMRNIVVADDFCGDSIITHDNDGNHAFEFLEYLAVHSMKNLQGIWKGPIAKNSFNCLQVLALHTCPDLTTVFTESMLDNLQNLTVVIVEDCPKINSLISWRSTRTVLPNLKKILLLDLPELVSLSNGVNIAPQLDTLLVFNCLKLDYLSPNELPGDVKEIKGETEWWDALKNKYEYSRAFVPLKRDGDLMNQLAEDTNSLKEFNKLRSVLKSEGRSKSADTRTEASRKSHDYILDVSDKIKMEEFRIILQFGIKSMQHSLLCNPVSITYKDSFSTQDYSSIPVVQDECVESITLSPDDISELRNIAVSASSNGYIKLLVEIYIAERKTMVKRFEVEELYSKIETWTKSVKTSLDYLFASEKQLCEEIFQGLGIDIEDICFEVVIREYGIQVFKIVHILSFSNPPPDKIFLILDLYQTLDHFLKERCSFAKTRNHFHADVHTQLLIVLAEKIIRSLSLFEMVLSYHESSVIFVGPVDPLPRYVMSYLYQLCDHKHTLRKLSLPKLPSIDEDDLILYSEELKGQSELSRHVIWIIMMIVSNLEGKAKMCEDGSAGLFFAMKNISYIVHRIEGHQELKEVIGYDYYSKLIQKLDHAKFNYLRLELEKIIQMRDYGAVYGAE